MSHVSATTGVPRAAEGGGFLALIRHRNYALLWTGQLVSQVGDRFHWVAISLWVYAQTGSALSVSYAILALLVGPAIAGLFAGALVDRMDRRKILIYGDLLRAVLVFAIPDLMVRGLVWVYLDLFLVSVASAFFRPAMFAAIPQSIPKDRLLQANAFFASMDTSTEIVGPVLAGLIISWRGYETAIYLDGISYLVSLLFVSGLRLGQARSPENYSKTGAHLGTLQSIRDGLRYIRSDHIQVALLAFLVAGYWVAGLSSLQTPLAKRELGITDGQFGWFLGVSGVGFVAASLLLGWYGDLVPRGPVIIFAYLLWALAAGVMGYSANYGMLAAAGFWVGFANMLVFVNVGTAMMERSPPDKLGRVITTRSFLVALIRATALLGFGWLADLVGVRIAVVAMAVLSFVGTIVAALRFPALKNYGAEWVSSSAASLPAGGGIRSVFSAPVRTLTRFLESHTTPEFMVPEQRRLNAISLLIVTIWWLWLLATRPYYALSVGIIIVIAVGIAGLVRRLAWRLRVRLEGKERGGG